MLGADDNKPVGKSGQRNRKTDGKAGQRNRKSAQKQTKPDQLQDAQEQVQEQLPEQVSASIASSESSSTDSTLTSIDQMGSVVSAEQSPEAQSAPIVLSESDPTDGTLTNADQVGLVVSAEQSPEAQEQVSTAQVSTPQLSAPTVSGKIAPTDSAHASTDQVAPPETVLGSFQSLANAYGDYTRKSFEQARTLVEKLAGVRSLDKAVELQTDFVKLACETFMTDSQKIRDLHRGLARQRWAYLERFVAKMAPIPSMPRAPRN